MIPYGGGAADVAFYRGRIVPGQEYEVWYDINATNRVTGLTDKNGVGLVADRPVADQNGRLWFNAPDDAVPVYITAYGDLSGDVARLDPANLSATIAGTDAEVDALSSSVASLQTTMSGVQADVSAAQTDITELGASIDNLEDYILNPADVDGQPLTWSGKRSTLEPVTPGTFRDFLFTETAHNGFPGLCVAGNGDLIAVWRAGTGHSSYDGSIVMRRSTDNGVSWQSGITLLTPAATEDWRDPNIARLGNGRLVISTFRRINAGPTNAYVLTSDDNGATWSAPIQVAAGHACSAPVVDLPSGDIILPTYSSFNTYLYVSPDDGATWSLRSTIMSVADDLSEPWAVYDASSNNLVCMIRNDTSEITQRIVSTDYGVSWGTATASFSSDSRVAWFKGSSGRSFAFYRDTSTNNTLMSRSSDNLFSSYSSETPVRSTKTFGVVSYAGVAEVSPGVIAVLMGSEQAGSFSSLYFGYVTDGPAVTPLVDITGFQPSFRSTLPGRPVVWDTFRRTSDTVNAGLGSAESGHWWHNTEGLRVVSNNAVNGTAASSVAIVNTGSADGIISAELQWNTAIPNTNPGMGIVFRRVDSSNYLFCGIAGDNATETSATTAPIVYLNKVVAGVATAPSGGSATIDIRPGQWFELTVSYKGRMVLVMIDGYPMIKWLLAAGEPTTGVFGGLRMGSPATTQHHKCRKFLVMQ